MTEKPHRVEFMGGPKDGDSFTVSESTLRSGYLRYAVPTELEASWFELSTIQPSTEFPKVLDLPIKRFKSHRGIRWVAVWPEYWK